MKKVFTVFIIFFTFNISYSQIGNSPYPVIFVHGLNSDDHTWDAMLTKLGTAWSISSNHTLSAVMNARGGDTTNYLQDIVIPLLDANGNIVNRITASNVYTVNFGNFWNRNSADPRIILYNNTTPGTNQSPSNQSAIYKQGYVLKILIDSVLRVTGASKVILAGHSMGGLAIREYLQRKENGIHKWWINPNDTVNGHKVAKVVTIGTPHLGTNASGALFGIDDNSESMRDMKISYSSAPASYLFSNTESIVPSSYYNKDINCNGTITDTITGLSFDTYDNPLQPLPLNISYTWITSNYLNLGTDGAVSLARQLLYVILTVAPPGISDTLLTNKNHIQETGDTRSLLRGLDEPDTKTFAYNISFNTLYSGFITLQTNSVTSDSDYYKVQTSSGGKVTVNLKYLSSGVTSISLLSNSGSLLASKNISSSDDSVSYDVPSADNCFVRIGGSSTLNANLNFYSFSAKFAPAAKLNLTIGIEGMWDGVSQVPDSIKIFLRSNVSPFNKIDSAAAFLSSSGNSELSFIHAASGNYYIQSIHRNALETWSSDAQNFINGSTTPFDFTSSQSNAFGSNQILKLTKWCIFSGDVNNDETVDVKDMTAIYNDLLSGASGYLDTDLTGDDIADVSDLIIAFNNSNNIVSVIRP